MNRSCMLSAFCLLSVSFVIPAEDGSKPSDFVTVQKGTLPIIVSAPHGGKKVVPGVPERLGRGVANFHTIRDENSAELTESFVAALEEATGGKPWVVIARFDRKYLDVNRGRAESYENEKAKPYYDAYHEALAAACTAVKRKFGRGILLDIHGNAQYPHAICRGTQNLKTVTLLKERDGMPALRGRHSVLGRMERLGYKVVPSAESDDTTKEVREYSGGYIVGTYGSHTSYAIDAIQLEFGTFLREKNKYPTTARDLADAVRAFYDAYLKDEK